MTEWYMDPKGYFIIKVFYSEQKIGVRHYPADELGGKAKHDAEFFGTDADALLKEILAANLIELPEHAGYLGEELTKAEEAMLQKLKYVQDEKIDFLQKYTHDPSENIQR